MISRRSLLLAAGAAPLSGLAAPALAQSAASAAPVTVRIGYVPVIGAASLYVLSGDGSAKEAGLEIRTTKFDSGPAAIQALASGTLDVMFIGVAPIAVARAKGVGVKVVSAASLGGSGFVASAELAKAFDAAGGDPVRALAGFRAAAGRPAKLGTLPAGAGPTVTMQHWLRKPAAVAPEDYTIVPMGIDAVQQALLSGAIDGGMALEPSLSIVVARKPGLKAITYAPKMFAMPGVVVTATDRFATEQPDALVRLIRLVNEATDTIVKSPDKAAPFAQAVLSGGLVDTATFAKALVSPAVTFGTDPRPIVAATQEMLTFQVEIGDFASAPATAGLFDTSFYLRAIDQAPAR